MAVCHAPTVCNSIKTDDIVKVTGLGTYMAFVMGVGANITDSDSRSAAVARRNYSAVSFSVTCEKKSDRSGIRTHAGKTRLRPERSALDRSAILPLMFQSTCTFIYYIPVFTT